ncbi:MAG: hypothetical protein IJF33_02800 [Clostridia bacterium]|nr:hypothetical protein [Clostridia bacterium]
MKKRFLCLFLCLVMLLSAVLTACSSKKDEEGDDGKEDVSKEASANAMTLSMWIVSEEDVSAETAAAVTKALNEISESKFNTRLAVHYLTEDEYRAKLEKAIVDYEAAKKQQAATETVTTLPEGETAEETVVTDETETNEIGMTVIKYPEELKNQVDIIYITGEDMYVDFIENGWLASLNTELEYSSKKINEYVSATLLNSAKHNGITYAIPNNHAIGQYTYMLLNKSLMAKYSQQGYIKTGKITSFYSTPVQSFLSLVTKIENSEEVVAIDNKVYDSTNPENTATAYDYCLNLLAHYWSIDPESYDMLQEFSVLGHHYTEGEELSRGSTILGFESLFENVDFTNDYLKLNKFRFDGYFEDATDKVAALKFMTGDYSIQTNFDDNGDCVCVVDGVEYYPIVVEYPTATSADIYGDMFGVYAKSRSVPRSMEIVTYLNTNADFRNILQYGVAGVHYELVKGENGTTSVKRLNNDYKMKLSATGNVFIAYPEPNMSADVWETGKAQNRHSLVDPLLGLDFFEYAASTGAKSAEEKINKEGYNFSFTTGYSTDVLKQDETLAKWLADSDAAGKGIYVYETSLTSGQNKTYLYYIYKNGLTNNVNFNVTDLRETTDEEVNGDKVTKQTNLDFILNYTDAAGSSQTGYELSVMRIYTRRTNVFEVLATENEASVPVVITKEEEEKNEPDEILDFDFYNTDEYSIEVYSTLTKATVLKNKVLTNWIANCDRKDNVVPISYLLSYTDPVTNVVTYVFYRTALEDYTTQAIQASGGTGELNINVMYSYTFGAGLGPDDNNYLLTYVRITPAAGVTLDVNYKITSNGEEVFVADRNVFDNEDGITDPDFEIVGNLDTELVKYCKKLNDMLVEKLNACEDYETFEATVKEISRLLCTDDEKSVPSPSSFVLLKDVVAAFTTNGTLEDFKKNLQSAVSYEVIKNMVPDPDAEVEDGEEQPMKEGEYTDAAGNTEKYVYFDSPYGIYYSWMNKYKYLPSTKK